MGPMGAWLCLLSSAGAWPCLMGPEGPGVAWWGPLSLVGLGISWWDMVLPGTILWDLVPGGAWCDLEEPGGA